MAEDMIEFQAWGQASLHLKSLASLSSVNGWLEMVYAHFLLPSTPTEIISSDLLNKCYGRQNFLNDLLKCPLTPRTCEFDGILCIWLCYITWQVD